MAGRLRCQGGLRHSPAQLKQLIVANSVVGALSDVPDGTPNRLLSAAAVGCHPKRSARSDLDLTTSLPRALWGLLLLLLLLFVSSTFSSSC